MTWIAILLGFLVFMGVSALIVLAILSTYWPYDD